MHGALARAFLRLTAKKRVAGDPSPLLIELLEDVREDWPGEYEVYPFRYSLVSRRQAKEYAIGCALDDRERLSLRHVVEEVSMDLDPADVEPLTFERLISVLSQRAAGRLSGMQGGTRVRELGELVAYEAVGLSRVLALAKDSCVSEFYVDSDSTPIYLDHMEAGRCETSIILTERERRAIETHLDTFRGYTPDYATPSLKNDIEVSGARLRVSLDLQPVSVNRFSLDVRRLSVTSFSIVELVKRGVLSAEAASFMVGWLETGGNLTIVGETGTGKTTLMNGLDEQVNPRLRRVYIEDAVETKDLLGRGYHQMKVKVDPLDKGDGAQRGKEAEIVKVLHRSPDMVILSEIQSEAHSRAFFHALASGIRGMQTFHASSVEQAVRRWTEIHMIPRHEMVDLGVLVQMQRPDRLGSRRIVSRVCQVVPEAGEPRIREIFARDRDQNLRWVADWDRVEPPPNSPKSELIAKCKLMLERIGTETAVGS